MVRVEETLACFVVKDFRGQKLAYVYFEDEPGRQAPGLVACQLIGRSRIAANIATAGKDRRFSRGGLRSRSGSGMSENGPPPPQAVKIGPTRPIGSGPNWEVLAFKPELDGRAYANAMRAVQILRQIYVLARKR